MSSGISLWMEESPRYEDAPLTTPYRISTVRHDFPLISGRLGAVPAFLSRDDELRGNLSPTADIVEAYNPAASIVLRAYPNKIVPGLHLAGLVMTGTQGDGANEVQTITASGTVSGGTYDLAILTTIVITAIPWNYTAAQVQALVDDCIRRGGTGFIIGDIVVGGGPLPATPMTVTYQGTQAAKNVATMVLTGTNLTGSTPAYNVTTTTSGSVGTVLLPDGRGLPPSAYRWQSAKRTGLTAKTARLYAAYAEHDSFEFGSGFGVTQAALGADGNLNLGMIGLVSQPTTDQSITQSHDAPGAYPFLDRDLLVTWRTGAGNISSLPWTIANPIAAEPNRATRSAFPGLMLNAEGFTNLTGTVDFANVDTDDRIALYEGNVFAARAHYRSRSKIGSTGAPYEMFVDIPAAQIIGGDGPEDLSAKRRFGGSLAWKATYDVAAGYDFQITVSSALSVVEQYA